MKRIATIAGGIVAVLLVAVLGAAMVMDDTDLESLVASLPGGARHAAGVVDAKRQTADGIAYWVDDTLYGLRSLWWGVSRPRSSGSGPRVVIELKPVRMPRPRENARTAPAAATATEPPEEMPQTAGRPAATPTTNAASPITRASA